MQLPDPTRWMPWLFALLALVFAVRAVRVVRRAGGTDTPAARAPVRVAIVFALITMVLFLVL